jgi:hypothetical protein
MKVINKVVITLALAVPTSTLVTADELVINKANHAFNDGTGQYTPDMREALRISPIGFEHVVVVPPGYDKPEVTTTGITRIGNGLQSVNLPHEGEIAARTEVLIP